MKSVLQVHSGREGIARVGDDFNNRRMAVIYNRWALGKPAHTHELFDDGLTRDPHCFNLEMENDPHVSRIMEELFRKTRAKGKTAASAETRRRYFEEAFRRSMHEVRRILKSEHKPFDAAGLRPLMLAWMWAYAVEFDDREIMPADLRQYQPNYSGRTMMLRALRLDRNNRGNATPPKMLTPASKVEICTSPTAKHPYVCFEWRGMDYYKACKLMGMFQKRQWDWQKEDPGNLRREFRKLLPHVVQWWAMDTPNDLYGGHNNWFYLYAYWRPKDFTWERALEFDAAVTEHILPLVGEFRKPEKVA